MFAPIYTKERLVEAGEHAVLREVKRLIGLEPGGEHIASGKHRETKTVGVGIDSRYGVRHLRAEY
jgi:hypothetical protein